jgi:hypothetical protein
MSDANISPGMMQAFLAMNQHQGEQTKLNRQLQMAQLMRQQGQQGMQSISPGGGRAGAPNWAGVLANIYTAKKAGDIERGVEQREAQMAQQRAEALGSMFAPPQGNTGTQAQPTATAEPDEPIDPANPYAARIAANRKLLRDPARVSQANRERQMAVLGMASGDAALSNLGRVLHSESTRRQDREDAEFARLEEKAAGWSASNAEARQRAKERAEEKGEQRTWQETQNDLMRRALSGNQALVQTIDPQTGRAVYTPRDAAVGMQPVPAGGGQPSEDERKAAGWLTQARTAYANMQKAIAENPDAAKPTGREVAVGALPVVGQGAAYAGMSPARQKFTTAASSATEAILRAATGAGQNREEVVQKIQELTPRYGEDASVTKMKNEMMQMYLNSLETRAGRAAPGGASGGLPRTRAALNGSGGASPPRNARTVNFADLPD